MKFVPYLLAICLIAIGTPSFAQNDNVGLYVSLKGAASVPTAQFRSSSDQDGGFAVLGIGGMVGAGIKFSPNFSIGANWVTFDNPVDSRATIFPNETPWRSNFLMADITGHLPLGNKVSLDLGVMAGPAWVRLPQGSVELGDFAFSEIDKRSRGFGYGGQFAVNYHLDNFVSFQLGTTYLAANPDFEQSGITLNRRVRTLMPQAGVTLTL